MDEYNRILQISNRVHPETRINQLYVVPQDKPDHYELVLAKAEGILHGDDEDDIEISFRLYKNPFNIPLQTTATNKVEEVFNIPLQATLSENAMEAFISFYCACRELNSLKRKIDDYAKDILKLTKETEEFSNILQKNESLRIRKILEEAKHDLNIKESIYNDYEKEYTEHEKNKKAWEENFQNIKVSKQEESLEDAANAIKAYFQKFKHYELMDQLDHETHQKILDYYPPGSIPEEPL